MGLAIIKEGANYTLMRINQNVIPADPSKRVPLLAVSNFLYGTYLTDYNGNSIYRLQSLNIGSATLPYVYSLDPQPVGASIDPISGIVTVTKDFVGNSITVRLSTEPTQYYNNEFSTTTIISPVHIPEDTTIVTYSNLRITDFMYNDTLTADADTSGIPVLHYSYSRTLNGQTTTITDEGGAVVFTIDQSSEEGANVNSSTGIVTANINSNTLSRPFTIRVYITLPGGVLTTDTATIYLQGATPVEELRNIDAAYNNDTDLNVGTVLSKADFTVMASYTGSSSVTPVQVTEFNLSPNTIIDYGNNPITVSYESKTDTVNLLGYDDITALSYNAVELANVSNFDAVQNPNITAISGNYNSYKGYTNNSTNSGYSRRYEFVIESVSEFSPVNDVTFAYINNTETNNEADTNKGTIFYNVTNLLQALPDGGILREMSPVVKVLKSEDLSTYLLDSSLVTPIYTASIQMPVFSVCNLKGWENNSTIVPIVGNCAGRSANNSTLVNLVPSTSYIPSSNTARWKYIKYVPSSNAKYIILKCEGEDLVTHGALVLNSDEAFLTTTDRNNTVIVTVENAVSVTPRQGFIYKLKTLSPIYLMYLDNNNNFDVTFKVSELNENLLHI